MKRSDSPRDDIHFPSPSRILRTSDRVPLWAVVRRRWTIGALLLFAFALIVIFGTPVAPQFVKPGNLSTAHAQILESDLVGGGCMICHDNVSANTWMAMRDSGHALSVGESLTMTQRCVACHHDRIPADLATSAHNLSAAARDAIGRQREQIRLAAANDPDSQHATKVQNSGASVWLPSVAISQDSVSCSVCHREHHGAEADLKSIADARCQTCHQQKFGSFADSHPEFQNWPTRPGNAIAFDHAKHASVHFPKTAAAALESGAESVAGFDCRSCHSTRGMSGGSSAALRLADSLSDPIVGTLPFEMACASCHDEALKVQIASGPALIELPILPPEVARQVTSWPAEATGAPDGKLSAWMLLLLDDQDPTADFSALADLSRVDWQSSQNQAIAVRLAEAIRRFAIALSLDGQSFLQAAAVRAGADEATAARLASSFPTQLMSDAAVDWFGNQQPRAAADRFSPRTSTHLVTGTTDSSDVELLVGGSLDNDDDLLTDWSELNATDDDLLLLPDDPQADPLLGGHLDSGNLQTGALGSRSGDPAKNWEDELKRRFDAARSQSLGGWYRDDLTLSIRYRGSGHQDVVLRCLIEMAATADAPLRDMVAAQPAAAACISCHVELPWQAAPATSTRDRMTRFTHRPHLDISVLQNCEHCHTMRESIDSGTPLDSSITSNRVSSEDGRSRLHRLLSVVDSVSARPERPVHRSDFMPLTKSDCAHCHTQSAAGDSCTTCHRYHVGDVHATRPIADAVQPVR